MGYGSTYGCNHVTFVVRLTTYLVGFTVTVTVTIMDTFTISSIVRFFGCSYTTQTVLFRAVVNLLHRSIVSNLPFNECQKCNQSSILMCA